jgi:CDP-diglyceride synthetase
VLAPLALALIILGGVPYFVGVGVMCGLTVWEATALVGAVLGVTAPTTWRWLSVVAGTVLLLGVQIQSAMPLALSVIGATILLVSLTALVVAGPSSYQPGKGGTEAAGERYSQPSMRRFALWTAGAASLVYIIGLGAHFILLRAATRGLAWTLLACLITWGTDTGAFFAGRRFGAHSFFSRVSPKKTVEGAVGGILTGTVVAVVVVALTGLPVPAFSALLLGASVSAAAQAGDLVESLLKREAGVKDSGTIIPGHGGVLDRIDSLLFAVAMTYYWSLMMR